jgi:hypothetical protein
LYFIELFMLDLLCGSLVGMTHLVLGQPLDYIKVKYQTNLTNKSNTNTNNFINYCK